jgi:hypothetical protein
MMRTDSVVKAEGMEILLEKLGRVDAERFVSLLLREPFDYTQWRTNLNKEDISVRELSYRAMEHVDI